MPTTIWLQRLRLATGLVLMAFVLGHLFNIALGLVSLDAVEAWHPALIGPWQTKPGKLLLGLSTLVHAVLGLVSIAKRRTLAMTATDAVQMLLALAVPPLLVAHVLVMGVAAELVADFDTSYGFILAVYWSYAPHYAIVQLCAVLSVWTHAAIGLYSYLVLRPVWSRIGGLVTPLLFAVPILALLGFVEAGKQTLAQLAANAAFRQSVEANWHRAGGVAAQLAEIQHRFLEIYGAFAALAIAILLARIMANRRKPLVVSYDGGDTALARRGLSILEFSRLAHIPHASVCSGRGRCGTCRVEVTAGAAQLSPQTGIERQTLAAVRAPPGARLACQARVMGPGVAVIRILPPFADASAARAPQEWTQDAPAAPELPA